MRLPHKNVPFIFSGCRFYGFLGTVASLAEIWSLTAIAVDRFKAVYHPLERDKRLGTKAVSEKAHIVQGVSLKITQSETCCVTSIPLSEDHCIARLKAVYHLMKQNKCLGQKAVRIRYK